MFGNKNIAIGLDIGSYSVKAVAIQPNKGRMTLQGYAQMRIGNEDPALIVRQVLQHLGVRPRNIVSAVSGRSVIVRQVETPRLQGAELRSHINYEADKYIPFGADEVVIDCQPLPAIGAEEESQQQVQLVAVRRGFIEDHVKLLNSAGLHPKIIDVDVFALCNAMEVFGPSQPIDSAPPTTALVDIGASKVCVAITKGNRPLFTREFYLAGNEITDAICRSFGESPEDVESIKLNPGDALEALIDAAMPSLEDIANEIRLSFDYVEGQFDEEVDQVVLTGGASQLATLGDIIGNMLGRPVQIFDPLSGIDLIPSRYDIQTLDANAPSLAVAMGLACHLAAEDIVGLGGSQVATWAPRHHRAGSSSGLNMPINDQAEAYSNQDTVATDLSPEERGQLSAAAPPPAPLPDPVAHTPPHNDGPVMDDGQDIPVFDMPEPPPVMDIPMAAPEAPPAAPEVPRAAPEAPPAQSPMPDFGNDLDSALPSDSPVPPAAALDDDNPFETDPAVTPSDEGTNSGTGNYGGHDSVLVILDDDDDMAPRTSDILRSSGTQKRNPTVSIDTFGDDDDDEDDNKPVLPPLE